jgi:hypothetical protein
MKFIIYVLLALLANAAHADGVVKEIARGYCKVTHPVEWIAPVRHENTCEEQHVLQQQHGGNDKANISIIPASSHIATDTWGGNGVWLQSRVWENRPEDDGWGSSDDSEDSLSQAYKLGRYQLEYAFILYDYKSGNWETTLTKWDGISHVTYAVAWWVNLPSKYIRKASYLIDTGRYSLLIDHAIQFPILVLEGSIGIVHAMAGFVSGTISNPYDTLNSIIGGVFLTIKSIIMGVIDCILSIWLLIKSIF